MSGNGQSGNGYRDEDLGARIAALEARNEYLEGMLQDTRESLDLAATLGDFQDSVNQFDSPGAILEEADIRLRKILSFGATAYFLVDEESSDFLPAQVHPRQAASMLLKEVDEMADNGTLAWILDRGKPSFLSTSDREAKLLVQPLATQSRIRGLFVGLVNGDSAEIPDSSLALLAIILRNCANTIESYELYRLNRQTAGQLRHARDRYQNLFETMSQGVVHFDLDGRILELNPAAEQILGRPREDILGRTVVGDEWALLCEDGSPMTDAEHPYRIALRTGEPVYNTIMGILNYSYGGHRWILGSVVPQYETGGGKPDGFYVTFTDITGRRASQQALRESEARFRAVFQMAGLGILLADPAGRIVDVNPAFAVMAGKSERDLRGEALADMFLKDDASCMAEGLVVLLDGDEERRTMECRFMREDGDSVWGRLTLSLVKDEEGRPMHLLCLADDITERMRAEEELRQSEQRLRRVIDTMPVLVHAHDEQGNYVFWNKESERVLGYSLEEARDAEAMRKKLYPSPAHLEGVRGRHSEHTGDFENWELPMVAKDGSTRIITWTSRTSQAPMPGWAQWETGVDITGRKLAEDAIAELNRNLERLVEERTRELHRKTEALEEANKRLQELDEIKSAFVSAVSHDIRTPLTSVLGYARLARRDFDRHFAPMAGDDTGLAERGERLRTNLAVISDEGERLKRLINDFLDLSRIESGQLDWNDAPIAARDVVDVAVRAVGGEREEAPQVRLCVDLEQDLPPFEADADRVVQVLVNLLHNAIKFTDEGTVTIRALRSGMDRVRFEVSDTGVGILPEEQQRVFDKFHQVARDGGDHLTQTRKGSGLGLYICRTIAEHYGGLIGVESEPGRGSTFYVEFPVRG